MLHTVFVSTLVYIVFLVAFLVDFLADLLVTGGTSAADLRTLCAVLRANVSEDVNIVHAIAVSAIERRYVSECSSPLPYAVV